MESNTWIELSRSALRRNVRYLRGYLTPGACFTSVVKGRAYGHGIDAFVPLAEQCGVRSFAAFSAEEARQVLAARTRGSDVMVMGHMTADEVAWAVEHDVALWVFDLDRPRWALDAARRTGHRARLHLELETGLQRTGLEPPELAQIVELLLANPRELVPEGVCTHLAGAESTANYLRIRQQIDRFMDKCGRLAEQGVTPRHRHMACSAAALSYPETVLDLVRFGIAQYGFWPSPEARIHHLADQIEAGHGRPRDPLKRILTWKSRVMSTKRIRTGEYVGYGNTYLTTRPTRIAILPVGYAHGFSRSLSNVGRVLVRGRRAPVVGYVGMNMTAVDVTDCPGVAQGDEVVLIGKQGRHEISVSSFSELSQFLNYEMLARLPADIPRVVVR